MDRDNYYRSYSSPEPEVPGRLPEHIYRRRRIAALIAILLLVVGVIVLARTVFGGSSDTGTAAASSTSAAPVMTTVSESSTSESATTSPAESSTVASESASTSASESTAKTTCDIKDLKMEASSNQPNYAAGDLPEFYMTIQNPTAADCVINLGEKDLRFEVYDMASNQRVWSDIDCHASVLSGQDTIAAGESRSYSLVWGRASSQQDTCEPRQAAPAGAYFLHTVIGDNASPAYAFNLL